MQIRKTTKTEKILAVTVLLSLLLGSIIGFTIAQSSNTFYVTSGVYPSGVVYTVYKEGLTYYAKNRYGYIDYESTNASYVVNSCISVSNNGGKILFTTGTFYFDSSILFENNGITLSGESQGTTIFNWIGSIGDYSVITNDNINNYLYDATIENLNIQTNGDTHAIWLTNALRFNIRNILISGYSDGSANSYHGIVLRGIGGNSSIKMNSGWGTIDNVVMDYVHYGIDFYGDDENSVVTLINVGFVSITHCSGYGLNFYQWADSIDIKYATIESLGNNVCGLAIATAHDTNDVGVYNIHVDRLIFDNWHYSGNYAIKINTSKQIVIDSVFKGNATDSLFAINDYTVGVRIVQSGQENGSNFIIIYYRNVTETEIPKS